MCNTAGTDYYYTSDKALDNPAATPRYLAYENSYAPNSTLFQTHFWGKYTTSVSDSRLKAIKTRRFSNLRTDVAYN